MKTFKSTIIPLLLSWISAVAACGQRQSVKTPDAAAAPRKQAQIGELVEEINDVNNGNGYRPR